MRGCIIVVTDTFWPVAIVIVATGAVDISITQNSSNSHCWHQCTQYYYFSQ
jgi:hypothetical protein